MNGEAALPEITGFTVDQPAGSGITVYRRIGPGTLTTDIELSDRVTCMLALFPTVEVHAVVIEHGDAAPAQDDLELAVRLAGLPAAAEALRGLATALDALDTFGPPGPGRLWTVEGALRALDVIELLGLSDADDEQNGVWPVWETLSRVATQALVEIPAPVRISGGNDARVAVIWIANRLKPLADRLSASRLTELLAGWPVPPEDMPPETPAEPDERADDDPAAADVRVRERVYRGGDSQATFPEESAFILDLDLTSLFRIGLADAETRVFVSPRGVQGDRAWEIRVPVRDEVGAAYRALMELWLPWLEDHRGQAVAPEGDRRAKLICAFGRLLAATHRPFTLEEFLESVALMEPAPPHLTDVVCLVEAGEALGPFVLFEDRQTAHGRVDLVATVPHEGRPTDSSISLVVRTDRTPLVTARRKTTGQRMLALRRDLASHGPGDARVKKAAKAIVASLDEPELIRAVRAEVEHGGADGGVLSPDVQKLADAIARSEPAIALQLQAAADQRAADDVERLCAHLSRTRAYLTGLTD